MSDNNSSPSEVLRDKLTHYVQNSDPLRASRNLRKVFFDYLRFQNGMTDTDFDLILTDIEAIGELLDAITDEKCRSQNKPV